MEVTARHHAIICLLGTLHDGLPTVKPKTTGAQPGFAHNTTAVTTRPDCLTNDRITYSCETCHGRGVIEHRQERDPYANTEKVVPYGISPIRREQERARDAMLDRLTHQLKPPQTEKDQMHEANRTPYPWEAARRRMYQRYDYRLLEIALDQLRMEQGRQYTGCHRLVTMTYVYRWTVPTGPHTQVRLHLGLNYLSDRMPHNIRYPGSDHPAERRQQGRRGVTEIRPVDVLQS